MKTIFALCLLTSFFLSHIAYAEENSTNTLEYWRKRAASLCGNKEEAKQKVPKASPENYLKEFDSISIQWDNMGENMGYYKIAYIKGDGSIRAFSKTPEEINVIGWDNFHPIMAAPLVRKQDFLEVEWMRGNLSSGGVSIILQAMNENNLLEIKEFEPFSCTHCGTINLEVKAGEKSLTLNRSNLQRCTSAPNELIQFENILKNVIDEWVKSQK